MLKYTGDQSFYPRLNWFLLQPTSLEVALHKGIGANMFKSYEFWKDGIKVKAVKELNTYTGQVKLHYQMCRSAQFAAFEFLFGTQALVFQETDAKNFLSQKSKNLEVTKFFDCVQTAAKGYIMMDENQPLPLFYLLPLLRITEGSIEAIADLPQITPQDFEGLFCRFWLDNQFKGEVDLTQLRQKSPLTFFKISETQLPHLLPHFDVQERYTSTVIRPKTNKTIETLAYEL